MSSVSSSSIGYNKFYDDNASAYSDSVDSIIDKGIRERRDQKIRHHQNKILKDTNNNNNDAHNGISSIFSNFTNCCAPAKRKDESKGGGGADKGGVMELNKLVLNTLEKAKPVYSETDDSEDDGATVTTVTRGVVRKTDIVDWRINCNKNNVELSADQQCWCLCVWSLRMENSERMNTKMITDVLNASELQRTVIDIKALLNNDPQFFPLELVRCVEARAIEDLLGDLMGLFDQLGESGAVYAILSKIRVMGIYARKQGEMIDIAVFDPVPPPDVQFGPSFIGFKSLDDMHSFVASSFHSDSDVSRAGAQVKFTAWLMRSRMTYGRSRYAKTYNEDTVKKEDAWKAEENARAKDPKYDAKVAYSAMLNATAKPMEDENVFSWAPGGGMRVETQAEVSQQRMVDDVGEMEEEYDADVKKRAWK